MGGTQPEARPNVANQVTRHFRLKPLSEAAAALLVAALEAQTGVVWCRFDSARGQLSLCYDATLCYLEQIEATLAAQHASVRDSGWQRMRRRYYRFVDQNLRDNAAHQPHCCSRAPTRR